MKNLKDLDLVLTVKDGIVTTKLNMPGLQLDAVADVAKLNEAKHDEAADAKPDDGVPDRKTDLARGIAMGIVSVLNTYIASQGQHTAAEAAPLPLSVVDRERLGDVADQVSRLRAAMKEQRVEPGVLVETVALALKQVDDHNAKQNAAGTSEFLDAPIITLWNEERWVDFIDALVPDEPAYYRKECVRILVEEYEDESPPVAPEPAK